VELIVPMPPSAAAVAGASTAIECVPGSRNRLRGTWVVTGSGSGPRSGNVSHGLIVGGHDWKHYEDVRN